MQTASVNLVNEDGKEVANYQISRLNVRDAMRRQRMFSMITEEDELVRGQLFGAASIACSLCDSKGDPVYPEKEYPDLKAIDELMNMDFEVYNAIAHAAIEVNPVTSLKAKKKKS
tara:strand:+ start:3285 stop:3629 length:345 start_codon:yes stop_codon:yes gene_type:complete